MATTPRRNPQVVYRDLAEGEGGVLLHLQTGSYHGLNTIGAEIWKLVDGERTYQQIVADLGGRLDTPPPPQLTADVLAFLNAMAERDLLG